MAAPLQYRYCCVGCRGKQLQELEHLIDHGREITRETFQRNVGNDTYWQLASMLGYEKREGLLLKDDWHVQYFKAKRPSGGWAYYMVHSAIEYVCY